MRTEQPKARARDGRPAQGEPLIRAFSSSLPMALLRARESVMRRFRPALRDHGVTEPQWRVLRALAGHPGLEITELAARTCLLPPSLSRILPDLEARGLIVRRPVVSDMRRAVVVLARGGLDLIASHAPQSERIYRAIEERFGSERLQQLFGLLAELEESVARLPAVRSGNGGRKTPRGARRSVCGTHGSRRSPGEVRKS